MKSFVWMEREREEGRTIWVAEEECHDSPSDPLVNVVYIYQIKEKYEW